MSGLARGRRGRAAALALGIAGIATALALRSGGFGARVGGADLYAVFLSKYRYVAETLLAGRLPLWNPFEYCGLPLHGTAQGGAFYPPIVLLNLLLPPVAALQALYAVHLALLVYLVLRYLGRTGIGLGAAAAGATLTAACLFNGLATIAIDHPNYLCEVAMVPAMLLAREALRAGRRTAAAALALTAGLQWLPGYPEIPLDTAVLLLVVVALDGGPGVARRSASVAALIALGALLAAVQLVPLAESVRESVRAGQAVDYAGYRGIFAIQSPQHLLFSLVGRYGAAGTFCLLLGLLVRSPWSRAWGLAFVWTLCATNRPFSYLYLLWPYAANRYAFGWNTLGPLFAGLLAAAGVERLRRSDAAGSWLPPALGATLAAGLVAVGEHLAAATALACGAAAVPRLRRRGGWVLPLALVVLHAGGIMSRIGTTGRWPAPDLAALAPRVAELRRVREALPGMPRILSGPEVRAGLALAERLPSPTGHEPAQAPRRMTRLGHHLGIDFLAFGNEAAAGTWTKLAAAPGAAAAVGIGLVAVPASQAAPLRGAGWSEIARLPDGDLVLYRRPAPRFRLVHDVRGAADEEESFRLVTDGGFDPGATTVLEGVRPLPEARPAARPDEERIVPREETPERIRLAAVLSSPGVLVVADAHYPGWETRVDGAPAPLLRADYALRAVALPAGTHEVDLAYRPRSFRLGALVSGLALLVTAGWWVSGRTRERAATHGLTA